MSKKHLKKEDWMKGIQQEQLKGWEEGQLHVATEPNERIIFK